MQDKASVVVSGGKIMVFSTYQSKEFWKSLMGREWDKKEKAWVFPATPVAAATISGAAGDKVTTCEKFDALIDKFHSRTAVIESGNWPQPETIKTPMWEHQRLCVAIGVNCGSEVFHAGMGTGKSAIFAGICGEIDAMRVLIVAPKKPMGVWPKQFRTHSALNWEVMVLNQRNKSVKYRADAAKDFMNKCDYFHHRGVVVVNYDAFWRPDMEKFISGIEWDVVGYDEIHRIKTNKSKASKFAEKLWHQIPLKFGLTGTMMAHTPLDAFGQLRAVDPGVFGRSFTAFRNRYAVMGGYAGHQILAFKNKQEMRDRIAMATTYVDRDKVLDLPEEIDVDMPVEMSSEALDAHKRMERDFYIEVERGDVVASNAISKLMKLAQITDGFVIDKDKDITYLGDDKKLALKDIAEDAELPLVVFCRFVNDLAQVESVAEDLGLVYHEVSGRRHELNPDETILDDTQILGVQIQSGSEGVDFTKACVAVFFSFGFSLKDWKQSRARLHRPGQTRPVTFIKLIGQGTIDHKIYRAIQKNEDIIESVLNDPNPSSKYDD